ncbi:efflux RND transporter periplasmic adaptor subunit [Nibricoccus sp. IMCC34717]|uniref:efflux RND transporter periplasmic adaptor subunit n=1 Tax=Nibricoccus sp. IMCC34717 TaxID=3034021 RepID=UPI00384BC5C5
MCRRSLSLVCLILPFAILAMTGCKKQETARRSPVVPVEVTTVVRREMPLVQRAIGSVQPLRTVVLKSQVDGIIASLHATEGDEVAQGALLVRLDQRPFMNALTKARADLETAEAEAEQARRNAERYLRLAQVSAISEEQESQLRTVATMTTARAAAQRATVANAELQLGYTEIRAPFAGRIGQFALHEGALVKANDAATALLTLHQIQPIAVSFAVPDARQSALRRAQARGAVPVTAVPREDLPEPLLGEVTFVDNAIDPLTGTLMLKAQFPNEAKRLWPGAFADVSLTLDSVPEALAVPDAAVQNGQNGPQVWVVGADNRAALRAVSIGLRHAGFTQLTSGVAAGETVVTDGQLRLTPGAAVQVRESAAPAAPTTQNAH